MIWSNDRPATPEQRLVFNILTRAYLDILNNDNSEARSAMHFWTSETGSFAHWRNHLCSLIDLDGDLAAKIVRSQLDGQRDIPQNGDDPKLQSQTRHARLVQQARERWLHLKYPHTPPLSPVGAVNAG